MTANDSQPAYDYPTIVPSVYYTQPKAAIAWLERAFGFETRMIIEGPDGDDSQIHAEMTVGDSGLIFVGGEWNPSVKSPKSVGGANTQRIHVRVDDDLDAHCAQARAAGARITREPEDQFYGDRTYSAVDLEGHDWSFAKPIQQMSLNDMARAGGVEIKTSL
jgi:uncharacterized glyoxalase superfamily protein PhnB